MNRMLPLLTACIVILLPFVLWAQPQHFSTSLHATRQGKITFYSRDKGGFEALTNLTIEELGCLKCHAPTKADGTPVDPQTYSPDCFDCHVQAGDQPAETICLGCHGREKIAQVKLQLPDVHRDEYGMTCSDCHKTQDVHGDGTPYSSMMEAGAIKVDCQNCHPTIPDNAEHAQHKEDIHCATCHTQTAFTCYNCHLNSLAEAHVKRAYKPLTGFMLLGVRAKDAKIHPGTFMALYYKTGDGKDTTFYVIAPNFVHNVVRQGRTCSDCHNNANLQAYNNTGELVLTRWDVQENKIVGIQGVVPIPPDWRQAFKLDFVNYKGRLDTSFTDPTQWEYVETGADSTQNPGYIIPLSAEQMQKLSMVVGVKKGNPRVAETFELMQNYPNPFNAKTVISFRLARPAEVTIKIYSILGEEVLTLVNQRPYSAGFHRLFLDGSHLASGIYLYELETPEFSDLRKMVLLK